MKKIVSLLVLAVMSITLFTGCVDPVFEDFENFLNTEMTEVNANYDKIKDEVGNWGESDDDAALVSSIENVLLPLVDDSLSKLEKINPETDEVKDLKDKYTKVMEAYKDGFENVLEGIKTLDEETILAGNDKISEGVDLLDEYNKALEDLAEKVGAEIEY